MKPAEVYQKLADHLNEHTTLGLPKTPSLFRILEVVFPAEEAEIALRLPMQHTKLSVLKDLYPEVSDLEEILESMIGNGTVSCYEQPGHEKTYCLLSAFGGWLETPFWGGKDTELARKVAPLAREYMGTRELSDEMSRGAPLVRVIPVMESVQVPTAVLPYDELIPKIKAASYRAVAFCICREQSRHLDEGCDHTIESCLHFGTFAQFMVEHDMAREITSEEAIQILEESRQEGLVHVANNMDDHVVSICNCCTCGGCYWLTTVKNMNRGVLMPSNYVAAVNADECIACGTCEDRCPMDAVSIGDDDCATVNGLKCIGCGVCTPTCDSEAIKLEQREDIKTPPKMAEWAAARLNAVK